MPLDPCCKERLFGSLPPDACRLDIGVDIDFSKIETELTLAQVILTYILLDVLLFVPHPDVLVVAVLPHGAFIIPFVILAATACWKLEFKFDFDPCCCWLRDTGLTLLTFPIVIRGCCGGCGGDVGVGAASIIDQKIQASNIEWIKQERRNQINSCN